MTSDHLSVMITAAKKAGEIQREHFRNVGFERKRDGSFLTIADKEVEAAVIEILKPFGYDVIAEESGVTENNSEYAWAIDPIDGTTNFAHGIPLFGVSIGLLHNGIPIAGVIYAPMLDELWVAEKEKGALRNDEKISCSNAEQGIIVIDMNTYTDVYPSRLARVANVFTPMDERRTFGCAILPLPYVADGRAIAHLNADGNVWDYAAGVIICQEAGCVVTDWDGKQFTSASKTVLAATPTVYKRVFEALHSA